ncbi:MAG TPA: recombinase family protein, partial [Dehalococcoidia bacterium]|nr:recombinase family protein [Dehalococcoidia bacterium]
MRAVAYIRVSDLSQVDGHSLDAQERLFHELCRNRSWIPGRTYREEGKSAHSDSIARRPMFRQLLDDASQGQFDVVVVHTLDRWARNLKVLLESVAILDHHGVGLVSITENLDWSTAEGRLVARTLGSFGEFFSDMLSTHVRKGISERARQGLHLGGIPFGYQPCWEKVKGDRQLKCHPEHPGGLHIHPEEGPAVSEVFKRYASGTTTLSQLANWLNHQGLRTRNMHKLPDPEGNLVATPRLFTVASVRGILHNPFYLGKVKHQEQLLPGAHEALISQGLFQTVQMALKKNSGRSETLKLHPQREYLLKGLIRCAHCGYPLWAQTYKNGHRYYREQYGSRGAGYCVGSSGSLPCDIPDNQMGRL